MTEGNANIAGKRYYIQYYFADNPDPAPRWEQLSRAQQTTMQDAELAHVSADMPKADIWQKSTDDLWYVYLPGDSSHWIRGPYNTQLDATEVYADYISRIQAGEVIPPV